MNLLNKLTIKNLKLNKKRTIVTIIGVMLSVALLTAVASIYTSFIKSLISFEIKEQGNYHVSYSGVKAEELEKFKYNRNIKDMSLTQDIGYAEINSKNVDKPYAYISSFSKNALKNLPVNLKEGRLPNNENEILVPSHLRTNGRIELKVGDNITLNVGKRVDKDLKELHQDSMYEEGEKIIDATKKTYKVVGIIERLSSNIEGYEAPGYNFVTLMDEKNLIGSVNLYARYTENATKEWTSVTSNILNVDGKVLKKAFTSKFVTEEEIKQLDKELEKAKYTITVNAYLIELETNPLSTSSVGGLGTVAIIIMGIIVFTSVFCIKNSFDISITEKIKQYGMLRSVGATKKQIKKNVFYEALILGIVGIPLGILLGFVASYILVIISNYYLCGAFIEDIKLEFSFSMLAVVIAIGLGSITIYLSALKSAIRASKVSPIDSIRNSANIKIKAKKIKSPKIIKKIFGIGGEISFKNLKRNKKKYRTTVISIVVSTFVFIALSSFMSMAFDAVDKEIKTHDYNISLTPSPSYVDPNKFIAVTKLDNIEEYIVVKKLTLNVGKTRYGKEYLDWSKSRVGDFGDVESDTLYISVIDDNQYKKYVKKLKLNYNEMKDKAIISDYTTVQNKNGKDKIVRILGYQANEKISGIAEEKEKMELEIGYITDKKPFGYEDDQADRIFISESYYKKMLPKIEAQVEAIYIKSNDALKLQKEIEKILESESYNINNIDENVRTMNNLFTLVGIFLYGFIIVITLIGITNIVNTISTNMELRKPEFAMLKSVGMTTKEFNRMIRLETVFMGIKSLFFGIPIGIGLSYLIYIYLQKDSGFSYELPIKAIIIAIVTVFILISIIMKYSLNKINKQNTIETIRNENI